MATEYKIIGQIKPSPNTLTNVFVTDSSSELLVNHILITNRDSVTKSYTLVVRPINETLEEKHFFVYAAPIPAYEQIRIAGGLAINSNAILAANTNSSNITFHVFGAEVKS
jgi:hypothetical protein